MENQDLIPVTPTISWSGSFPQNYEDNLNFIFGPYAEEMANRVEPDGIGKILELACGTGSVTRRLIKRLNPYTEYIASDLSPDMMKVGEAIIEAPNIKWEKIDMCEIPFPDNYFDQVVCQFGLMFAPDKSKALNEMFRVLKPGGKLLFNTWGLIEENPVFGIFNEVLKKLMNFDLGASEQGPFSLQNHEMVTEMIKEAGFQNIEVTSNLKTGESPSAELAAKGFFKGSLLSVQLKEKNPALAANIQLAAEKEYINQLGDHPMKTNLKAWFFEAVK